MHRSQSSIIHPNRPPYPTLATRHHQPDRQRTVSYMALPHHALSLCQRGAASQAAGRRLVVVILGGSSSSSNSSSSRRPSSSHRPLMTARRPSSLNTTTASRTMGAKSIHASSFRSVRACTPHSCSSSRPASKRHLTTSATTTIPTVPPTPTPTPHAPPVFDWVALDEEKKIWSDFEDNDEAVLVQDLRSDHAGETGAVWIYAGAKAAMTFGAPDRYSPEARAFVSTHHATEAEHLAYFDRLLDTRMKSKLLPLWKISGWCLGFFPTLIGGEPALFLTVEAVETFVEEHYKEQIFPLECSGRYPELLKLLRHCCEEEVHHKEDAAARWLSGGGGGGGGGREGGRPWYARVWVGVVGWGSKGAVAVCKRI